MKIKILAIFIINFLFLAGGIKPVFALEHSQKDGLFSIDMPKEWRWVEAPEQVILTYPDGKTVAIDIEMIPSKDLSQADIKKTLKEANDKMIKDGIEAHHGTLIDNKEISLDGVYATRLDFKTSPENPVNVTYISFFNKGYAVTVTYGSGDYKIQQVLDDVFATIKLR